MLCHMNIRKQQATTIFQDNDSVEGKRTFLNKFCLVGFLFVTIPLILTLSSNAYHDFNARTDMLRIRTNNGTSMAATY
jgi:hypothetical protein